MILIHHSNYFDLLHKYQFPFSPNLNQKKYIHLLFLHQMHSNHYIVFQLRVLFHHLITIQTIHIDLQHYRLYLVLIDTMKPHYIYILLPDLICFHLYYHILHQ